MAKTDLFVVRLAVCRPLLDPLALMRPDLGAAASWRVAWRCYRCRLGREPLKKTRLVPLVILGRDRRIVVVDGDDRSGARLVLLPVNLWRLPLEMCAHTCGRTGVKAQKLKTMMPRSLQSHFEMKAW
jgi:hypothetical protein